MSEEKISKLNQDEKRINFLIDQAYKEVNISWIRTNIFLVLSIAALGAVISGMSRENELDPGIVLGISIAGFLFSVIWLQVNRMSRYYADRWLNDARRIAHNDSSLKSIFYYSLGFREHQKEDDKVKIMKDLPVEDIRRPRFYSATRCIYLVIIILGVGWLTLLVWTIVKL